MKRPQYSLAVLATVGLSGTVLRMVGYLTGLKGWDWPPQLTAPHDLMKMPVSLLLASAPLLLIGVWITALRLRDIGWPAIFSLAYLVPGFNLALIAVLMLVPSRDGEFLDSSITSEMLHSATMAVALTAIPGALLTALAIWAKTPYGWALFVGLPFFMGMASVWIYTRDQYRSMGQSISVASISILITGGLLLIAAVEGFICLVMAAPIAFLAAIGGAAIAHSMQRTFKPSRTTTWMLLMIIVPMTMGAESAAHLAPPEWVVHTSIDIDAPPSEVWKHVIEFPAAPPPHELAFRAGIAYPIKATLHGSGVGAMRTCDFSTGSFIETIDAWDPGHRMEFSIRAGADPMTEMTPYPAIHPPHLDGYLHPRHAIFELVELPGGRTRLLGTSYYRNEIWPAQYWRVWSDEIIHTIHRRVFEHIKRLSERG